MGVAVVLGAGIAACCSQPVRQLQSCQEFDGVVDALTESEMSQAVALASIEYMESTEIPCLVRHLADLRPLANRRIDLPNTSIDAFEGRVHYTPETVHDALSAVLNANTGVSFISVYNGSDDQSRVRNARLWLDWCEKRYGKRCSAVPVSN